MDPAPERLDARSPQRTRAAAGRSADRVRAAIRSFAIRGELVSVEPFRRGHIHDTFVSTFRVGAGTRRYLHQRLNQTVFGDVPGLMHNIEVVTRHLETNHAGEDGLHTLRLVPTQAGRSFARGPDGAWRTFVFVEDTESFDQCRGPDQAYEAARAFGDFQAQLMDLEPGLLRDTIPDFFSAPHRLAQLERALAAGAPGRVALARPEIDFVLQRRELVAVVADALAAGRFPLRVVHGDTKLNNVLFDRHSGKAACVVDLDTVMPAWSLYDFGDLVRFTAATSAEDEPDTDLAGTDLELYRALVAGYLETAGRFLTDYERELMPTAARLVTLTIGMRFLADFLQGDVYFKTARDGHNLDRARVQLRMVELMERRADELRVVR